MSAEANLAACRNPTWPSGVAAGYAFVQNLRRGHCEIATDEPAGRRLVVAFTELAQII